MAAGRCQYRGCNEPLYRDPLTQSEFNQAYVAHIIADSPSGPRGHPTLSEALKADISNIMLLCDRHHRLIDRQDVEGHPVELLQAMKKDHEIRIELQTDANEDMQSHILLFGANIGNHSSPLNFKEATLAIAPLRYPASHLPIEIGYKNSSTEDDIEEYWRQEIQNLKSQFQMRVTQPIIAGLIKHLSVFALAPQPLLIELGRLIGDINKAEVHQRRREPTTWEWDSEDRPIEYKIEKPTTKSNQIALNLSLSAPISNERIVNALGNDSAIWTLTINEPNNDFLHSRSQLSLFRKTMRSLFDTIKLEHGQDTELHIFPAMPVSTAVELGRVWMPKVHPVLHIYDQNQKRNGFFKAHTITHT